MGEVCTRLSFPGRPASRWRIASRLDHPDPAAANALALADLTGGADALRLVSADAPAAYGFGIRLEASGALDAALDGVALDLIRTSLDTGPDGFDLADDLLRLVDRRGLDLSGLDLDLGIDPVAALATSGAWPADWPTTAGRMADVARTLSARGFAGQMVRADGRPWHAAGASGAQELGAVLSIGILYLRALEAGGIPLAEARAGLSFALAADTDLVSTIAKFRALRSLWARIDDACGLESRPIRLHAETAWRPMSTLSPHTNVIRGALACFGAAAGGAESIDVLPFTLPLGLPDAAARRLARNTQHVLAEESQIWRVADPAAGAGVFEAATRALCDEAWALFQEVEREGGIVASLVGGLLQARVGVVRAGRDSGFADGRDGLVGVTLFRAAAETRPAVLLPAAAARETVASGPLNVQPLLRRRDAPFFEQRGEPA